MTKTPHYLTQALALARAAKAARQALLQQTQNASRQMAQRAAALAAQQTEYKIKSELLGVIQAQEQANLGELLSKAASLTGDA